MRKLPEPRYCFLLVATGIFLSTMDSSMVNIAIPYIMESLGVSLTQTRWVVLSYLLVICMTLLIWGKLSDYFSTGTIYLSGMAIFAMGALFCSMAPNLDMLIVFRLVQGCGAAMMMATGPAIIRLSAPQDQLGKWLGTLGIATSIGLMSGPFAGGILLQTVGWRALFLLYIPLSVVSFILGWFYLVGTLPKPKNRRVTFDKVGAILWAATIAILVIACNYYENISLLSSLFLLTSVSALIFIFIRLERSRDEPLFPVSLFYERYYLIASVVLLLSFSVLFFALILMPLFFKYAARLDYHQIGYMMMAVPASLFFVSPLAGRLYDRIGGVYLTSLGLVVTGCALMLLAQADQFSSMPVIACQLALLGCGQSIFLSPNSASVLSRVSLEDTGITAGVLATSRNLGMLLGVALATMIFSAFFQKFTSGGDLNNFNDVHLDAFLKAFRHTLSIAAILAFLSAILSLARK